MIDDEDEDAELEDEDEDYPTEISVSAPQEKHTPSETGLELGKVTRSLTQHYTQNKNRKF